jgi:hypothetical protein
MREEFYHEPHERTQTEEKREKGVLVKNDEIALFILIVYTVIMLLRDIVCGA